MAHSTLRLDAAQWKVALRNMKRCPYCFKKQGKAKKRDEKCDNPECKAKVIKYEKELIWRHESNFGFPTK